MPVVPLAQFQFHSLVSGRVSGLVMSGLGTFDATRVQVARVGSSPTSEWRNRQTRQVEGLVPE